MADKNFISSEPLFFKIVYGLTFLAFLYVLYEMLFLETEQQSQPLKLIVLALFGVFFIRKGLSGMKQK
ncbi:hypothetical protein [Flavobacterium lindanitolerans]|uniref:hypothetical protein n=1 Tax=Flavobacterium lindanitolerans TaxID=428988 RepID=UPI00280838FD|nr:hypothetical protein [Flavobacterium lindanitolerans]MDQ7959326.1 hypothetical protein [Flavobacterium lindanitolerans]